MSTARQFYQAYWVAEDPVALENLFLHDAKIHCTDVNPDTTQTPKEFAKYVGSARGKVIKRKLTGNDTVLTVHYQLPDSSVLRVKCKFTYDTLCELPELGKPLIPPSKWSQDPDGKIAGLEFSVGPLYL